MAYQATVYRVLIASPSDVINERRTIPNVINSWNATHSEDFSVVLLPVMWETHSTPEMGDRAQAIINRQLVFNCDILICTFWTRIGTHTGVAESGTIEEIEEFKNTGKPVLIYFSSIPVVPESVDPTQYSLLNEFRKKIQKEGLIETYGGISELREKVFRHLTNTIRKVHGEPSFQITEIDMALRSIEALKDQYQNVITRAEVDWSTERDRKPDSTEDARFILKNLASDLLDFRSNLQSKVDKETLKRVDELILNLKKVRDHELFLDGGKSYKDFWENGDKIFNALRTISFNQSLPKITDTELDIEKIKILKLLAKTEDSGSKGLEDTEISHSLNTSLTVVRYHIGALEEQEYIYGSYSIEVPAIYNIDQKGRQFLIQRKLL
jgi:hypothetical protein